MKRKCLLLLLSLSWTTLTHGQTETGPEVARVNGSPISQMRLEHYFADYLQAQGRALGSIRSPTLYKRLYNAALDDLIDRELLWQEALKRGVSISDSQVQAQVDELRQAFGPERFPQRLSDAGFDEQSFADYTRRELAAQQVYAELGQVAAPDEAQVQALVEQNRAAFALAPGEVSEPPRTESGGQLMLVENHSSSTDVEREQALAMARTYLTGQAQAQARKNALAHLRTKGHVERIDSR